MVSENLCFCCIEKNKSEDYYNTRLVFNGRNKTINNKACVGHGENV